MHKIPVGVLGASGYAGRELCSIIEAHPRMELAFAAANGQRGQEARIGAQTIKFTATDEAPLADADLVFSALPHGTSVEWVEKARTAGARVVDLSSDLRIGNDHGSSSVPYGLTELRRAQVQNAELVANPGCYATAILLALAPLIAAKLIDDDSTVSVSAASGVTGAGFTPRPDLLFAEVAEDFRAYGVGNQHRHVAEMRAVLQELGSNADIIFTPHLLPVARGILATIVVRLKREIDRSLDPWIDAYRDEPFIELSETTPSIRDVVRRNAVKISAAKAMNTRHPTLIVTSAIDNLTKGAAGQAVQNANLMLGLDETAGLAR